MRLSLNKVSKQPKIALLPVLSHSIRAVYDYREAVIVDHDSA